MIVPGYFPRRKRGERSEVRPHVNLFVGSENVRWLGGLDAPVGEAAVLTVVPAVSGG